MREGYLIPQQEEKDIKDHKNKKGKANPKKATVLLAGALSLVGVAKPANVDWQGGARTVGEQVERGGRIYGDVKRAGNERIDAETRRKQVEEQARIERERIATEERMRKAEIEARKQTDMAREKTQRQERAGDVAIQTGKDEFSTETTDDKTTFKSGRQGSTPQERIEAGRNLSEENRLKIQTRAKAREWLEKNKKKNPKMYNGIEIPVEKIE